MENATRFPGKYFSGNLEFIGMGGFFSRATRGLTSSNFKSGGFFFLRRGERSLFAGPRSGRSHEKSRLDPGAWRNFDWESSAWGEDSSRNFSRFNLPRKHYRKITAWRDRGRGCVKSFAEAIAPNSAAGFRSFIER